MTTFAGGLPGFADRDPFLEAEDRHATVAQHLCKGLKNHRLAHSL